MKFLIIALIVVFVIFLLYIDVFLRETSSKSLKYMTYKLAYKMYRSKKTLSMCGSLAKAHAVAYPDIPFEVSQKFFEEHYPEFLKLIPKDKDITNFWQPLQDRKSRIAAFKKLLKETK